MGIRGGGGPSSSRASGEGPAARLNTDKNLHFSVWSRRRDESEAVTTRDESRPCPRWASKLQGRRLFDRSLGRGPSPCYRGHPAPPFPLKKLGSSSRTSPRMGTPRESDVSPKPGPVATRRPSGNLVLPLRQAGLVRAGIPKCPMRGHVSPTARVSLGEIAEGRNSAI